ncbi:hypothetical protein CY34DRAFT_335481 [Suillus luteus UH-Slu-Lm8-n1]|uniref:Uncharacterized protein n=1 Tax=Suillus luteus UH-Slu-Lm8-n1 TaxID=930992 RepID=A0A0D0AYP8_9AGAM|nr:hypothetical protein CY34DRAFT_335481 [Suillus luteus UH-Slu-Lm8-n1]
MRRSKKADAYESSIQSYSSKSASIAFKSVSQAVQKSVGVLVRPVKTILPPKKTRLSLSSSTDPSVIDVDAVDTTIKSITYKSWRKTGSLFSSNICG